MQGSSSPGQHGAEVAVSISWGGYATRRTKGRSGIRSDAAGTKRRPRDTRVLVKNQIPKKPEKKTGHHVLPPQSRPRHADLPGGKTPLMESRECVCCGHAPRTDVRPRPAHVASVMELGSCPREPALCRLTSFLNHSFERIFFLT